MPETRGWPFVLWFAQLGATLPILGYAGLRLRAGPPPGPLLGTASVLALLWSCAVIGISLSAGGRLWILRRRLELLISLSAAGLTLLLADLSLTLSGKVPTVQAIRRRSFEYQDSASSIHRMVPKIVEELGRPPVRINSRGLRGAEVAVAAPEGRARILFLGGSFIFDIDGANWPRRVEDILRAAGHDVEVLNAGVPGHMTADSLGKLVTAHWLLEPDVVFVCHAWNDIKYFAWLDREYPYRDFIGGFKEDWRIHPRGLDRLLAVSAVYRLVRGKIIRGLIGEEGQRPRGRGQIGEVGPAQYRLNLRTILHVIQDLGAIPVLCKQPRLPTSSSPASDRDRISYEMVGLSHDQLVEAFARTDAIVEGVARASGSTLVDLHAALSGRSDLFLDHVHLNPEGGREAARIVASALQDLLREPRGDAAS